MGIVLLIRVVAWFVFGEEKEFTDYPIRNDDCESSDDCVVENMDCSMCSCNMKAVSKIYAEYHRNVLCVKYSVRGEHCDMICEWVPSDCVNGQCLIVG